jgi:hypothetical protein
MGVGGFAEHALVTETGAVKLPDDTPLDIACVIGTTVLVGAPAIEQDLTIPHALFFGMAEKKIVGCFMGAIRSSLADPGSRPGSPRQASRSPGQRPNGTGHAAGIRTTGTASGTTGTAGAVTGTGPGDVPGAGAARCTRWPGPGRP